MLVLLETSAGYAIFKLLDEKKLQKTENLYLDFETPEGANRVVKLKHFAKFLDTTEALAATTAGVEGKLSKSLKKALKVVVSKETKEQVLVAEPKLGNAIKEKLSLNCLCNTAVSELIRCISSQRESLLTGLPAKEITAMALGLSHSLSRYKLKFSPDKVDTMIVQAICLLDELDKELNNYVMRCREWYGWHFPEMGKILTDNISFVKTVKLVGTRENMATADLSDILPENVEEEIKEAAEISMGTEISEEDIINIQHLCDQVIEISNYRVQLYEYLQARMMAIAPNLTILLGELVGARLISHAGSLINLAKQPASTVQILGAEKALFRALKTKMDTPKYGLIYHASLISQASSKNKGKMSRMLAAKTSLVTRVDALGEGEGSVDLGTDHKIRLEAKLRLLEEGNLRRISGTAKAKSKFEKYYAKSEVKQYPAGADSTMPGSGKRKYDEMMDTKPLIEDITPSTSGVSPKKKKKRIKLECGDVKAEIQEAVVTESGPGDGAFKKLKKKKKIKVEPEKEDDDRMDTFIAGQSFSGSGEGSSKKKKKRKKEKQEKVDDEMDASVAGLSLSECIKQEIKEEAAEEEPTPKTVKKKKKKSKVTIE